MALVPAVSVVGMSQGKGVAYFVRGDADAVTIDPPAFTTAPSTSWTRATDEPQHGRIVVQIIEPELLHLLTGMGHLHAQPVNVASVG